MYLIRTPAPGPHMTCIISTYNWSMNTMPPQRLRIVIQCLLHNTLGFRCKYRMGTALSRNSTSILSPSNRDKLFLLSKPSSWSTVWKRIISLSVMYLIAFVLFYISREHHRNETLFVSIFSTSRERSYFANHKINVRETIFSLPVHVGLTIRVHNMLSKCPLFVLSIPWNSWCLLNKGLLT